MLIWQGEDPCSEHPEITHRFLFIDVTTEPYMRSPLSFHLFEVPLCYWLQGGQLKTFQHFLALRSMLKILSFLVRHFLARHF